MIGLDLDLWGVTAEKLRELALASAHPRTRERLLALYEIANDSWAARVARSTDRDLRTVLRWVHRFNSAGPDGVVYRRSGGRPPFRLRSSSVSRKP